VFPTPHLADLACRLARVVVAGNRESEEANADHQQRAHERTNEKSELERHKAFSSPVSQLRRSPGRTVAMTAIHESSNALIVTWYPSGTRSENSRVRVFEFT